MFSRPPQWLKWCDGLISKELLQKREREKKKQSFSLNSSEWVSSWETSARTVIGNRIGIFSLTRRDLTPHTPPPESFFLFYFFFFNLLITSPPDIMNGASAFGEMRQTRRIIETAARFSRWRHRPILRLRQNKSIVITFRGLYGFPGRRVTEAAASRKDYYR